MQAGAARHRRSECFGVRSRRSDFVSAYPELGPVCDSLGFGSASRLDEWSANPQATLLVLARAARPPLPGPSRDWSMASIQELVDDIVNRHHRFLRLEVARIEIILDHLMAVCRTHALADFHAKFSAFREKILMHLDQEEIDLFPLCIRLEDAARGRCEWNGADITASVRFASQGYVEYEQALLQVLDDLAVVETEIDDPDFSLIKTGLKALALDLEVHTAKETELLIPAAIFAEEQLRALGRRRGTGSFRALRGIVRHPDLTIGSTRC